ncbi:antileukoproteinase-like [Sagmatias obliquidens]|uniref:antileukoproteinase-like n=1 Tax=Sagmatias obliquidens TaxID=3371155 RepID=UPI000F443BFA|nr:antileukoproteinase-like [Lagenorhynchus obliquidens]
MKPSSLTVFLVIFAFGFLTPWVVEGGLKEKCKSGACPFLRLRKCIGSEPSECWNDWQCPRRQKCCYNGCGRECRDPVFAEDSELNVPPPFAYN